MSAKLLLGKVSTRTELLDPIREGRVLHFVEIIAKSTAAVGILIM